ncbi:MAG: NAD-dependent epimerase/dehydratase family protein [Bacteroidia bacterium]
MKIGITGASGFLGSHLVHYLLMEGHEVLSIKRSSTSMSEFNVCAAYYNLIDEFKDKLVWFDCELYDTIALSEIFRNCDVVIHCAGLISYLKSKRKELIRVNEEYTANVVNACLGSNVRRFIGISSTGALSKKHDNKPIKESFDWDEGASYAFYGLSKYLGDKQIWRAKEEGLDVIVLNPGVILGYGDWNKGSLRLFRNAYTKFPFYSTGSTGFIGVEDLCKATVHFINSAEVNEQYVAISENLSFDKVSFMMAKAFKTKAPYIKVSGLMHTAIHQLISFKEFIGIGGLLSRETSRSSVLKSQFDNSKLVNTLPFDLEPIESVIQKACLAYNKNSPPR